MEDDLRNAYDVFVLLATRYGSAVSGLMMGTNPPSLAVIGNCTERGHDLARLHRVFADLVDAKTDSGGIEADRGYGPVN